MKTANQNETVIDKKLSNDELGFIYQKINKLIDCIEHEGVWYNNVLRFLQDLIEGRKTKAFTESARVVKNNNLNDAQIGKIYRKANELVKRLNEGVIDYEDVLNQILEILGFQNLSNPTSYNEKDYMINLSLVSNGLGWEEWIDRLEELGYIITDSICSDYFEYFFPSKKGTIYNITILKWEIFSDKNLLTKNIYNKARELNLANSSLELGFLLREALSNSDLEKMGLSWLTVISPQKPISGKSRFFSLRNNKKGDILDLYYRAEGKEWRRRSGFVFENSVESA